MFHRPNRKWLLKPRGLAIASWSWEWASCTIFSRAAVDINPFMERMIRETPKCRFGFSASLYHSHVSGMKSIQDGEYRLPCVSNVSESGEPFKLYFSNEDRGMFGIPKIVFGSFGTGVLSDPEGRYACTQDTAYIEADVGDLEKMAKVLKSSEMLDALGAYNFSGKPREFFPKLAIKRLAENFWEDHLFSQIT